MDLKFVSWNARELETLDRKYMVKIFLKLFKNIHVLLLQELKVVDFWLDINLNCIWREAQYNFTTKHTKGKGGASIFVSHK